MKKSQNEGLSGLTCEQAIVAPTAQTNVEQSQNNGPAFNFDYGDPIDFEFEGRKLTGIVDSRLTEHTLSAVYSCGNTWGALILTEANKPRRAEDEAEAMCSGLNYCSKELASLQAIVDDDDVAQLIHTDVCDLQAYLLTADC